MASICKICGEAQKVSEIFLGREWIDMGKVKNTVNATCMSNNVGIGIQDFLELRENHKFYIFSV